MVKRLRSSKPDPFSTGTVDQEARRLRNISQINLVTAILMPVLGVASLAATYLLKEYNYSGGIGLLIVSVTAWLSLWLYRRGRPFVGIILQIVILLFFTFLIQFFTGGQGIQIGILAFVVVTILASQTLPPHLARRAAIAAGGVAIIVILLDLYWTVLPSLPFLPERVIGNSTVTNWMMAVLLVVFGWRIARQYSSYTLSGKLLIAFLVVALAPLLVNASMGLLVNSRNIRAQAENTLYETALQVADVVDGWVHTELETIRTQAQLPDFVNYLSMSPDARLGSLQEQSVKRSLAAFQRRDSIFISSYALLDSNGIDVIDTYVEDVGLDKSDRDYFGEAIRTGLPYCSPVRYSQTVEGLASLYFSAPVRDDRGAIVGVLRVRYDALILQKILSGSVRRDVSDLYAVLVDDTDFIRMAHSQDPSLLLKTYASLDPIYLGKLQQAGRLPPGSLEEISTKQDDVVEYLRQVDTQPVFTSGAIAPGDERVLSAVVRMDERPWLLVTRQSEMAVLQPIELQRRAAIIQALITVLLVAAAAVGVSQVLTRPITRLTQVAAQVSTGDLEARADFSTADEIGQLATTFNLMTDQLRSTLVGLEQRVAERTRALELSSEVSRRLSLILDPADLVAEVVQQIQNTFNYYHVHIYLFDETHQNLIMVGGTGEAGKILLERGHKLPAGRGLVGRATETGTVVLVPDTSLDPNWLPNPLLPETKSEVAVPILIGDQILGALDVQQNIINGLSRQDADLLSAIASQVAIALRNARQYLDAQRQAERAAQIDALVQQIQRTQTITDALQVTVRELGRALDIPRTLVSLDPNKMSAGVKTAAASGPVSAPVGESTSITPSTGGERQGNSL